MSPTVSTSDTPPNKQIPGVMASWPASLSNFCKLVEEASFGNDYDSSIHYGLRLKKDESEILGLDRFMRISNQRKKNKPSWTGNGTVRRHLQMATGLSATIQVAPRRKMTRKTRACKLSWRTPTNWTTNPRRS